VAEGDRAFMFVSTWIAIKIVLTVVCIILVQIDDPAGAFSIHGLSGIWGVMFVGLLAKEDYIIQVYKKPAGMYYMGIFYGGHGQLLLCQFIAVLVAVGWSVSF